MAYPAIAPVVDDHTIPDDAKCQEASPFGHGGYIPCGAPATAIVFHEKDRRSFYMCAECADHNVRNRGGELRAERTVADQAKSRGAKSKASTPQQAVVLLEPADRQAMEVERNALLALQLPDEIISPQEYEALSDELARVEAFTKRVKPAFDEVCDQAHKAWKSATNLRAMFFSGLEAFTAGARRRLGAYVDKQERIRREEERRRQQEERQRLERQREAEAKALKKSGQTELAEVVKNTPVQAPTISLPSAVPTVAKQSFRDEWKWRPIGGDTPENRVRALGLLVPKQYLQFVAWNDAAMTSFAKTTKGTVKIPGIEFFCEKVLVRR